MSTPDYKAARAAIVELVNAAAFTVAGEPVVAKGGWTDVAAFRKLQGLRVRVLPRTLDEGEDGTRAGKWSELAFAVHVTAPVDPDDTDAVDALIDLELAIRDLFIKTPVIGGQDRVEVGIGGGTGELYAESLLLERRTFHASIELTLDDPPDTSLVS